MLGCCSAGKDEGSLKPSKICNKERKAKQSRTNTAIVYEDVVD